MEGNYLGRLSELYTATHPADDCCKLLETLSQFKPSYTSGDYHLLAYASCVEQEQKLFVTHNAYAQPFSMHDERHTTMDGKQHTISWLRKQANSGTYERK